MLESFSSSSSVEMISAGMTPTTPDPAGDGAIRSNSSESYLEYPSPEAVVMSLFLLAIIIGTAVGNVLVCVAVCLVRRLRRPCNYLLVSLAVSDLCVALLVMPMALVYEVLGTWPFGARACDAWVAFDVLSCTASILNLCMISVDRYWAITRPLDYGVKRTPRRMFLCVALVWLLAACISLPPLLLLGNDHGPDGLQCIVCQAFGYQIYATLGSFYIPLAVMAAVYYKIFQAAHHIIKEEKKAQRHLSDARSEAIVVTRDERSSATHHLLQTNQQHRPSDGSDDNCTTSLEWRKNSWPEDWNLSATPPAGQNASTVGSSLDIPRCRRYSSMITGINDASHDVSPANGSHVDVELLEQPGHGQVRSGSIVPVQDFARRRRLRLRFALAKERKASTTLGIIMSAFTLCWLPFFVLALVRPFMTNPEVIPHWLSALFLWLGYVNSLLNPVIYATTNKDFRLPFKEILCLRCKSLNDIMREEFYQFQYGESRPVTALNTTSMQQHSVQHPYHSVSRSQAFSQAAAEDARTDSFIHSRNNGADLRQASFL